MTVVHYFIKLSHPFLQILSNKSGHAFPPPIFTVYGTGIQKFIAHTNYGNHFWLISSEVRRVLFRLVMATIYLSL